MATRFAAEKEIFKQENGSLAEAKAERQLAEEKQFAAARLATAEASMAAAAERECEEEDAMSTQKADEEQSVLAATTNLLAASAAKVEERAAVVEAQNKAGDDAEVHKAEENVEMVFKAEKELAEAVGGDYEDEDFEDVAEGDMQEVVKPREAQLFEVPVQDRHILRGILAESVAKHSLTEFVLQKMVQCSRHALLQTLGVI